jgi:hypothetical protein
LFPQWQEGVRARWEETRSLKIITPGLPKEFVDLFDNLFEWLTKEDRRIDNLLDRDAVERSFSEGLDMIGECPLLYSGPTKQPTLLYRLMVGPGFVDGSGAHQFPEMCEPIIQAGRNQNAATDCGAVQAGVGRVADRVPPRGPGLREMQKLIDSPPYAYSVMPGPEEGAFSAFGQFIHLPREVLWATGKMVDGQAKIVRFLWVPRE